MRVLLIEDDPDTAQYVINGLEEEGHTIDHSADGREGMTQAMGETYDVLIVDRMLPGIEGLAIVKTMRSAGCKIPIIFLTALGGVDDRVDGLDAGGDDYLTKPFAFSELLARINALSRRPHLKGEETRLKVGDLALDLITRKVYRGSAEIDLQPREFRLLEVLMRNKGRVVTRTMLLERVWSFHFDPKTSVVETHISRLRSKIDKPFATELIHTVRGSGYSLHEGP
ncbi:MAG: response regulator transcription factor [Hyphomicrobium sp.]|jgi:two-component system OmpR family response regulator|uniref:winged helix-turn-helix domain-containing protein n=1 Tax=Hyphomicrobium sp. TaxID=82 RepID=UPI0025BB7129|nr:response regulator transcription factor [Hyphomicrobium sp.]MBX9863046.1 response regulator transcription factor [Hyphomicrobium sp.]